MNLQSLSQGLTVISIILLIYSLGPVKKLVNDTQNKAGWVTLGALIFLFILGYLTLLWHLVTVDHEIFSEDVVTELLVSLILFGGSFFVVLVTRMSEKSVFFLQHLAALERHNALHDQLTGLPNRTLLRERMEKLIKKSGQDDRFSVLLMDLDHFKEINDTLGHHVGDRVLQKIAPKLVSVSRSQDTVARLGGDEFSVLLPGANEQDTVSFISRLQESLKQHLIVEQNRLNINLSIGICSYPEHGEDVDTLLQHADVAMYLAKQQCIDYALYNPDLDIYSVKRLRLSQSLERAIFNNRIELFYQPVIDLKKNKVKGFEALSRWRDDHGDFISPADFIPLAEQAGWIQHITRNALKTAILQLAEWGQRGLPWTIAVNLSLKDFNQAGLVDEIRQLLAAHDVPAFRLVIEITETSAMTNLQQVHTTLEQIHEMGISIAVDDFGTGYSSLSHLRQMPVNTIKIDRSFISDMLDDDNDAVIVRSTIDLAHNMGKNVIAEGVSNQDMADILDILGCDYVQGFLYSPAIPAEEIDEWYDNFCKPAKPLPASQNRRKH